MLELGSNRGSHSSSERSENGSESEHSRMKGDLVKNLVIPGLADITGGRVGDLGVDDLGGLVVVCGFGVWGLMICNVRPGSPLRVKEDGGINA